MGVEFLFHDGVPDAADLLAVVGCHASSVHPSARRIPEPNVPPRSSDYRSAMTTISTTTITNKITSNDAIISRVVRDAPAAAGT